MGPYSPHGNDVNCLIVYYTYKSNLSSHVQVLYHVVSSRNRPLYRHFSVTSLEYSCGLDIVHGTRRRTHHCFHFTISIGSPRLDFDGCRRNRSHHQYIDHLGARYYLCHLSIQLPQYFVLLGLPGRGLQRFQ